MTQGEPAGGAMAEALTWSLGRLGMFPLPVNVNRSWPVKYTSEERVSAGWASSSYWSESEQNPFLEAHILWKALKDSSVSLRSS